MIKRSFSFILALVLVFSCFSLNVQAAETSACGLVVESVYAAPGASVEVNINIENNPGILGAAITLEWDEGLTLIDCANGPAFSALTLTTPSRLESGCNFIWYGSSVGEVKDGSILSLTFALPANVEDAKEYEIRVSYDSRDILDEDYNEVALSVENGTVRVVSYIPGDVTGDKRVNPLDLIKLCQFISDGCVTDPSGYNITINTSAADVNDDGRLNPLDLILISRYISDGCVTDPDGYNVTLKPSTPRCKHTMETVSYKAASCEEDGNISYYHCNTCGKYYNDKNGSKEITLAGTVLPKTGHTSVTDPYVAPTVDSVGWTEGSHCSVCNKVLVAQKEIPKLQKDEYHITYHISESDLYLQSLESQGKIKNENPASYFEGDSITLLDLYVPGYTFEGWYDGAGVSAEQIKKIAGQTGAVHLHAHWTKLNYKVQFDAPLVPMADETYTVDTGLTLDAPDDIPGYLFMGWTDASGNLVEQIPIGSVGPVILYGNWTSARNQTRPNTNMGAPIIHFDEANDQILFAYEIGTVENIPLVELEYIGNVAVPGTDIERSVTTSITIDETSAKEVSEAISNATTKSSEWTLSSEWTESSSISESHLHEMDSSVSSNTSAAYSNSGTFNISTSNGGSSTTAVEAGVSAKVGTKVSQEASIGFPIDVVDVGAKVSTEISAEIGAEVKTSQSDTKTWNTERGYSASQEASFESSVSQSLAEKISNSVTYDVSKAATEGKSNTESTAETSTNSREYASSFTYGTSQFEEKTYSVTLNSAPVGYYRMVAAGKAHVFGVVVYDIATRSYGTYTYSIMEDTVRPFLDYSKESDSFNDNENGVLPFVVPYYVNNYVDSIVGASDGLQVDLEDGTVIGYTGNDEIVIVPQYIPVDDGDDDGIPTVVKITGISSNAFTKKTNIKAVQLCKNVTSIPDGAFAGCTSLVMLQAPAVTSIGANAFSGCTSLKDYEVDSSITSMGTNAFAGVENLSVIASNAGMVDAAIGSGAKNISVNLKKLSGSLSNKTYNISAATEKFSFIGNGAVYQDVQINSDAQTTEINNMTLQHSSDTALVTSSPNVVLNRLTLVSPGISLKLNADNTNVGLYGTVNVKSTGAHAAFSKNASFFWSNSSVAGKMVLDGNLLVSGDPVQGDSNLSFAKGKVVYIDAENPVIVTFDPNDGSVAETSRLVYGGTTIGELPVPARDYHTFCGWYTAADGGDRVTADTLVATDMTVYARWEENTVSDWVLASELPEGAQVINQKWSYTQTLMTESKETSLAGYNQVGSYWVQSGTGSQNYSTSFPSGFDQSHSIYTSFAKSEMTGYETETTKREVTNAWAGYVYWHWMYDCGGGNGTANRAIYHKKGTGPDNGFYYKYFGAFTSTNGNYSSDTGYCNSQGIRNYIIPGRTAYADCQGATRWFRFDYYMSTYTDYYKMFQYQKIENLESATEVSASDTISNVQEWVQYRAK